MSSYKYIEKTLQAQYKERDPRYKAKLIAWRKGPVMEKVDKPTNLTRARRLGYKAKQGYILVRIRIDKGRRTRRKPSGGRKPKSNYRFVQPGQSHQVIAEQRVNRKYRNMEVLNSYWIGEDGNHKFYEVILIDSSKPSVNISAGMRSGKSFRGLTSAGQKGRPGRKVGLNKKLRKKKKIGKPPKKPFVKKTEKKAKATIRKKGAKAVKAKKKVAKKSAKKAAPKAEKKA